MAPEPTSQAWLDLIDEPIVDPDLEIVDPHHHLWHELAMMGQYLLDELWADTGSGHRVTRTVFVECGSEYRTEGPEHLRPVGETEFVAGVAASSRAGDGAEISGIVASADLADPRLDEVLDAHEEAGQGLFRGIRHALSSARHPDELLIPGRARPDLSIDPAFRRGVAVLGERGLTYDTWHYHHQMPEFIDLARAVPGTTMVLDHFGTPLGVGSFAGQRDEIFAAWCDDIDRAAACENVVLKAGGMAMPDNGYAWHERDRPPDSDEFVDAQGDWYRHAIDAFGPDRVMFESNFPVDRLSLPYAVYWNAVKKLTASFDADERAQMFSGTASRVYRL
jgi:predicted TIM-barrel fold metal-dependent hydrolase